MTTHKQILTNTLAVCTNCRLVRLFKCPECFFMLSHVTDDCADPSDPYTNRHNCPGCGRDWIFLSDRTKAVEAIINMIEEDSDE